MCQAPNLEWTSCNPEQLTLGDNCFILFSKQGNIQTIGLVVISTMKERMPSNTDEGQKESFVTLDGLVSQAEQLFNGLRTLSERKHPFEIRRGIRKGVDEMADQDERSRIVKAGAKTYFFDIKETKDEKPYLMITESRFKGEGEDRERISIAVFPENAQEFSEAVSEMTAQLAE